MHTKTPDAPNRRKDPACFIYLKTEILENKNWDVEEKIYSNYKFIFEYIIHIQLCAELVVVAFHVTHQLFWIKRFHSSFIQRTHFKADFSLGVVFK